MPSIGPLPAKDVAFRIGLVKPHLQARVRNAVFGSSKVFVLESKLQHSVQDVRVRVVSAGGDQVGEFTRPSLDGGSSIEAGWAQVSRNLQPGDRVTVWLSDAELLTYTVE